jgi:hypothetical protein
MKRRLWFSLLLGFCVTLLILPLSTILSSLFPYTDKAGMPNPLTWELMPGLFAAQQSSDGYRWFAIGAVVAIYAVVYGAGVFCIISFWNAVVKRN